MLQMINEKLKVFILEDLKTDLALVKRQALKYNPNITFTVANNRASFFEKIEWFKPDVILSDFNLPDFNGLKALLYIKEKMPNVPFIFVTSTLNNEELVAKTILDGASGFVLKQNMSVLPDVLKKVLEASNEKLEALKIKEEKERQQKVLLRKLEAKIVQLNGDTGQEREEVLRIVKKLHVVT